MQGATERRDSLPRSEDISSLLQREEQSVLDVEGKLQEAIEAEIEKKGKYHAFWESVSKLNNYALDYKLHDKL